MCKPVCKEIKCECWNKSELEVFYLIHFKKDYMKIGQRLDSINHIATLQLVKRDGIFANR